MIDEGQTRFKRQVALELSYQLTGRSELRSFQVRPDLSEKDNKLAKEKFLSKTFCS